MTFICKCGHSRGKHENPNKGASEVGTCLAKIGEVPCGCRHYKRDLKRSPITEYERTDLIIFGLFVVIAFSFMAITFLLDGSPIIALLLNIVVFGLYWYEFGKSYNKRFKQECLE